MKKFPHIIRFVAVAVLLALNLQVRAHAASSSGSIAGVEKFGEAAIRDFTLRLNDELDRRGVNVAIVARAGRSRAKMPAGINYTHVGLIVFEPVRTADGAIAHTFTVYNLYQGDEGRDDRSYLAQDFTYDFLAGVLEPDVAVCVPAVELQRRILAVVRSPSYRRLHNPGYNLVANPGVDKFDNCVTHTLKICVAAIYQTDDRARIYDDIRAYFHPTPVRLGPLQAFGSTFMRSLSREDMDRSGLRTATYDSLKTFLEENGLVRESFSLRIN